MPLSKEEQAQLEELERKRDEPEQRGNSGGRSEVVNVTIDLSDEAAVNRAIEHGYLTRAEVEAMEEEAEEEAEEAPRRRLDKRYS